jgi:hypothetical protein
MNYTAKLKTPEGHIDPQPPSLGEQAKATALLAASSNRLSRKIVGEAELLAFYLPVCRRTLGYWKEKRLIPYIKIGRRCLYDIESVRQALLRHQREVVV